MNCIKCGRETGEETVFCSDCLLEMDKYPVQPGTVVLLPRRREASVQKKAVKRRTVTPEEQVVILRKWVMILSALVIVCVIAIALMFRPTMHYVMDEHFEIGQNYSSVTPAIAPTAPIPTE